MHLQPETVIHVYNVHKSALLWSKENSKVHGEDLLVQPVGEGGHVFGVEAPVLVELDHLDVGLPVPGLGKYQVDVVLGKEGLCNLLKFVLWWSMRGFCGCGCCCCCRCGCCGCWCRCCCGWQWPSWSSCCCSSHTVFGRWNRFVLMLTRRPLKKQLRKKYWMKQFHFYGVVEFWERWLVPPCPFVESSDTAKAITTIRTIRQTTQMAAKIERLSIVIKNYAFRLTNKRFCGFKRHIFQRITKSKIHPSCFLKSLGNFSAIFSCPIQNSRCIAERHGGGAVTEFLTKIK